MREVAESPDGIPFDDAMDATMAVFEMMRNLPSAILGRTEPKGGPAVPGLPDWYPGSTGASEDDPVVEVFRDFEDEFEDD